MAILGKIRQRSIFLILVIGMALFAFVISGVFDGNSSNSGTNDPIAIINDEEVGVDFFRQMVDQTQRTYNYSTLKSVNLVWNQALKNTIFDQEFKKESESNKNSNQFKVDMFLGIGGGPEGVLAAAALDTYECHFQGRFIFDNDKDILEAKSMGITDLNKKYELNEIVKGDSLFCASGITSSDVLNGTILKEDKIISETLVTHKSSNFRKVVKCVNPINE